ncbi:MAG TPA: hypothetical protein VGQ76_09010 [Thermoanaerobaculia bacterium]|nr:hypothetical protein [Thermoanaerobaculia bacterium]
MKRVAVAFIATLFLFSCRTGRPDGVAIAPLTATSPDEAIQQLRVRRAGFNGLRSLMRVRATTNGKTQSFRAQLAVLDANRMELTAYTPVGTTALVLKANGEDVSVQNRIEGSEWEGNANDLARSFGFLGAGLSPAEMAMLIAGIPPRDDLQYEVDTAGLRRASFGDVVVVFDPPSFPAQSVVVTRGQDRVEIEHLEVVQ